MLPQQIPKTGIKITKQIGQKSNNGITDVSILETEIFNGLAIIDDDTASVSQIFTEYGIERKSGYVVYLETNDLILKKDTEKLRVYFNELQLHKNLPYSSQNLVKLIVKAFARKNSILLSHIMLLCYAS